MFILCFWNTTRQLLCMAEVLLLDWTNIVIMIPFRMIIKISRLTLYMCNSAKRRIIHVVPTSITWDVDYLHVGVVEYSVVLAENEKNNRGVIHWTLVNIHLGKVNLVDFTFMNAS